MRPRLALLALPAVLVLAAACGGSDTETEQGAAPATSAAAPASSAPVEPSPSAPSEAPAPSSPTFAVSVAGGEIAGGLQTVEVPLGQTFSVTVTSDVADELHLHGYDVFADVAAGGSATITQEATIPGIVFIELEDAGLTVIRIASQ